MLGVQGKELATHTSCLGGTTCRKRLAGHAAVTAWHLMARILSFPCLFQGVVQIDKRAVNGTMSGSLGASPEPGISFVQ